MTSPLTPILLPQQPTAGQTIQNALAPLLQQLQQRKQNQLREEQLALQQQQLDLQGQQEQRLRGQAKQQRRSQARTFFLNMEQQIPGFIDGDTFVGLARDMDINPETLRADLRRSMRRTQLAREQALAQIPEGQPREMVEALLNINEIAPDAPADVITQIIGELFPDSQKDGAQGFSRFLSLMRLGVGAESAATAAGIERPESIPATFKIPRVLLDENLLQFGRRAQSIIQRVGTLDDQIADANQSIARVREQFVKSQFGRISETVGLSDEQQLAVNRRVRAHILAQFPELSRWIARRQELQEQLDALGNLGQAMQNPLTTTPGEANGTDPIQAAIDAALRGN